MVCQHCDAPTLLALSAVLAEQRRDRCRQLALQRGITHALQGLQQPRAALTAAQGGAQALHWLPDSVHFCHQM